MTRNPFDDTTDADSTDAETETRQTVLFNDPGPITQRHASGRSSTATAPTSDDRDSVPNADAVSGADTVWVAVESGDRPAVRGYRGHTTRRQHNHSPRKHDLTEVFNVNPTLVADVLYFQPDDHAAVHELIARRSELENHDENIFTDTNDTDEDRWYAIESVAPQAHISEETLQILINQFGYSEQFETRPKQY